MYQCVCGYEDDHDGYLHQHQVACFLHIRDERDRFKQALRSISLSISPETLAESCCRCYLKVHEGPCFFHIRDERNLYKRVLQAIADSTKEDKAEVAQKVATETLATSCCCP